jgi:DNA-binding CsgD family transcriptional regulator
MSIILHLGPEEQRALQTALADLLFPAAQPSFDAWRGAVNASVSRILGADSAGFVVRAPNVLESYSAETPRFVEYIERSDPHDRAIRLWSRQESLVVWSRPLLWGRHLAAMYRSSYYHDYVKQLRGFDTIGVTVRSRADAPLASLHFWHESERGIRFGDRGLAILRMIEPAFRAGLQSAFEHFHIGNGSGTQPPRSAIRSAADADMLTPREREVALLLGKRRSNREIADVLGISRSTAKRHTEHVLAKLGVRSRREVERILVDD